MTKHTPNKSRHHQSFGICKNNVKCASKIKKNINIINDDIPEGIIFGNSADDVIHAYSHLNNQNCRICNRQLLIIINHDYRYDVNCLHKHSYHTSCLINAVCESYDKYILGCNTCHKYIKHIPTIKTAMQEQNAPEPLRRSSRIASMNKINYKELNGNFSDEEEGDGDGDDDSSYEESEELDDDDYDDENEDDDVILCEYKKTYSALLVRFAFDFIILITVGALIFSFTKQMAITHQYNLSMQKYKSTLSYDYNYDLDLDDDMCWL